MEVQKQIEMLEENIICLKAAIIREKRNKQKADEIYQNEKPRLEQNIQELQLEIENLKKNDEDWEPMTDIQVDRRIEEEVEKEMERLEKLDEERRKNHQDRIEFLRETLKNNGWCIK